MRGALLVMLVALMMGCSRTEPALPLPAAPAAPPLASGPTQPGRMSGCRLVHRVKPSNPAAKGRGLGGAVRIRAVVEKAGGLRILEVVNGDPVLIPAAVDVARQWRYTPCVFGGEHVEVITVVELSFGAEQ